MMLIWLAAGIVGVTFVYLSPSTIVDPWDSLNPAGIAAGVYLLTLCLYTLRPPLSRKSRIRAWIVLVIVGGAIIFSWTGYEAHSHFQAGTLSNIRERISRDVTSNELANSLLNTLEVYHAQKKGKRQSLGSVFRTLHDGTSVGTNIYKASWEGDKLRVTVAELSDDEVILVAQEANVKGRDPSFRNLDGGTGLVQERARLTEKGIDYESQN